MFRIVSLCILVALVSGCSLGSFVKPGLDKCVQYSAKQGSIIAGPITVSGSNVKYHSVDDEKCAKSLKYLYDKHVHTVG